MKLNLPTVTNSNSLSTINGNFEKIEQELQNKVLYRDNPDGEPNTLESDVDANGQDIFNAGAVKAESIYINGERIVPSGVIVVTGDIDPTSVLYKANNLADVQSPATSRVNLGLGNVDNTSDINKPVSAATASALATKQNTLVSGSNIKTINGNSVLGSGDLTLVGVGETNTTSNLGIGVGLAASKSGVNLPFKSLIAGSNITITPSTNEVTISAAVDTTNLLVKANNLSDVQSAATSRTNLGLGNVDNTSDLNKPISTATSSALAGKQATLVSGSNIKTINGSSILGSGDLTVSGGSTSFIAAGAGAVTRTMQDKARDFVSVKDYGAVGSPTNDSSAFQAAINSLPSTGGRIVVPDGAYVLNTTPDISAKESVYWDIGPGCTFSGTGTGVGKFPYNFTNTAQMAVGPLIQSRSTAHSEHANGGIQALGVEMLQPDSYGSGQSVAIYAGAYGNNSNPAGNVWAINALIKTGPSAAGTYQCIEVDVDSFSSAATVIGISMTGVGTQQPYSGIEINRADETSPWRHGIQIFRSNVGLQINTQYGVPRGIVIGAPAAVNNTPLAIQQSITGGDGIFIQRLNSGTSGYFLRCVDEANSTSMAGIRADGQIQSYSVYTGNVQIISGAASMPAGQICLGNTMATSATPGGISSPGNFAGFWCFFYGGSVYKIPYFNS